VTVKEREIISRKDLKSSLVIRGLDRLGAGRRSAWMITMTTNKNKPTLAYLKNGRKRPGGGR